MNPAMSSPPATSTFSVTLSYQGQNVLLDKLTATTTGEGLHSLVHQALQLTSADKDGFALKLLLKGKRVPCDNSIVFAKEPSNMKAPPKVLVMASAKTTLQALNARKQDPTIRGFDQERTVNASANAMNAYWGNEISKPDKNYKFGRLRECPFHDFGHRPSDTTPHAFAARQLLQQLATDPGVIAILQERELVVGTLGEMDPVDDRIMQKKQHQSPGACLLGYNTNHGLRIDVKLRTDDLAGFRPYFELVATLIHELSHNWVGDHNALFWANYGQMRVEYFMAHKRLQYLRHRGQSSAALATIPPAILQDNNIVDCVLQDLQKEMAQHQLHPVMIVGPITQRYQELESSMGLRLGGGSSSISTTSGAITNNGNSSDDKRSLALEAAERRAREQKDNHNKDGR